MKYTKQYTSAASDWSHLPVGTEFRIEGIDRHFVIDDYGSALVGRKTVDLYFPSKREMWRWGLRHVNIIITKMGDFEKSRRILAARRGWRHCRAMLVSIDKKANRISPDLIKPKMMGFVVAGLQSGPKIKGGERLLSRKNGTRSSKVVPVDEPEVIRYFGPELSPENNLIQFAAAAPLPPPRRDSFFESRMHTIAPIVPLQHVPLNKRIELAPASPAALRKREAFKRAVLGDIFLSVVIPDPIERVIEPKSNVFRARKRPRFRRPGQRAQVAANQSFALAPSNIPTSASPEFFEPLITDPIASRIISGGNDSLFSETRLI